MTTTDEKSSYPKWWDFSEDGDGTSLTAKSPRSGDPGWITVHPAPARWRFVVETLPRPPDNRPL